MRFGHSTNLFTISLFVIIAATAIDSAVGSLTVLHPQPLPGENPTKFNAPTMDLGPDIFALVGTLARTNPLDACEDLENADEVVGKIALVENSWNCYPKRKMEIAQAAGALGAVLVSVVRTEGINLYYWDFGSNDHVVIPGVDVNPEDVENLMELMKNNDNVTVEIIGGDSINPWTGPLENGIWWTAQLYMQIIGVATILLAVYKIYLFYKASNNSWENKLVNTIMVLNICAAFVRMVKWWDPISTRGMWRWGDSSFWATTSYPFTIASMLMLSFYWMQLINMKGGGEVRLFLTSGWKYLAYFITVVVFLLEMATAIMRLILFEDPILAILTGMGSFLITMIVSVYFLYSATKIIHMFKNSGSSKKIRTRKIGYLIVGCACVMIVHALVSLGIATPWFDKPIVYTVLINLWYPIFSLVNLTQVSGDRHCD